VVTESMIYWIFRLDYIRAFCIGVAVVSSVAAVLLPFAAMDINSDDDLAKRWKRRLFRLSALCAVLFISAVQGSIFIPTTQEMILIKVIPVISNSKFMTEQLPGEMKEFYDLGRKALISNLKGAVDGQK